MFCIIGLARLTNELEDGLRRARIEPRGNPLADIAWDMRDAQPEKASQISDIILDMNTRDAWQGRLQDNVRLSIPRRPLELSRLADLHWLWRSSFVTMTSIRWIGRWKSAKPYH